MNDKVIRIKQYLNECFTIEKNIRINIINNIQTPSCCKVDELY